MTTDDQGKEKTHQERLDEIKREEKEDASDYYSQGSTKNNLDEEAEFSRPVVQIQQEHEEMNMLKAVAFLGFGMAALAIIFILFFTGCDKLLEDSPQESSSSFQRKNTLLDQLKPGEMERIDPFKNDIPYNWDIKND